ncbi:Protein of unknown function [Pyronema omphalodes CBS 100304]|uniref:Uncharacterized protein n=1 Tax=Pyronema omphalodes (strain CBS 100304) TaxID=1076935 RepID=U4L8S3_PYROM|nr:Protein of unknown function [Pyronema omphalodes CBS 100304]
MVWSIFGCLGCLLLVWKELFTYFWNSFGG